MACRDDTDEISEGRSNGFVNDGSQTMIHCFYEMPKRRKDEAERKGKHALEANKDKTNWQQLVI